MQKTNVLLVDDHTVVRQGLRAILEAENDIGVVGEAETGRQAVELAEKLLPDVVVMDIAMPQLNGLEATRQISHRVPSSKVLILSSYNDDEYVRQLTDSGASGYLVKSTAGNELLSAIREVSKGNAYFSPTVSRRLLNFFRAGVTHQEGVDSTSGDQLTVREREVLQLIAEGKANKQIAADLFISIKTVEKHRQKLMNKLNIHNTAGLTRYAAAKGIIEDQAIFRPL